MEIPMVSSESPKYSSFLMITCSDGAHLLELGKLVFLALALLSD